MFRNSCVGRQQLATDHYSNDNHRHKVMANAILLRELGNQNWPEIESSAFDMFVSSYCISSPDRTVSRGYLNDLASLLQEAGPESGLAKACQIISLANLGKKANSPMLLRKAEMLYFDFLPSFRWIISIETKSTTTHSFVTAVLLGLYEVSFVRAQRRKMASNIDRSLQVRRPS